MMHIPSYSRRCYERSLQIRKKKKDEYLHKRRGTTPRAEQHGSFSFATAPEIGDIPVLIASMRNLPTDANVTLNLRLMHEILRADEVPTVQHIVEHGCIPFIASLLKRHDCEYFQDVSSWMLVKVAVGGFSRDVDCIPDALEDLVALLLSPYRSVREQVAYCLGTLAKARAHNRDKLRELGFVQLLLCNIHESDRDRDDNLLAALTFALSSMCHGWPHPHLDQLTPIIYFGVSLVLDKSSSVDVTKHALQCLADISGGGIGGSQAVSGIGAYSLIQRLVQILSDRRSIEHVAPALRTLRNICDHVQAYDPLQAAVRAGFIGVAQSLFAVEEVKLAKVDLCNLLRKVASGKKTIVKLTNSPVLTNLIGIAMEGNSEWPVRKEAIQALCHVAQSYNGDIVEALVNLNGIEAFVEALFIRVDDRLLFKVLKAVETLVETGEQLDTPYGRIIKRFGGIDRIEILQNHANPDVADLSQSIIDRYSISSER